MRSWSSPYISHEFLFQRSADLNTSVVGGFLDTDVSLCRHKEKTVWWADHAALLAEPQTSAEGQVSTVWNQSMAPTERQTKNGASHQSRNLALVLQIDAPSGEISPEDFTRAE